MGSLAQGKTTLGTQIPDEMKEYFVNRAERTETTPSRLLRGAVEFWLALGAPPLTRNESTNTTVPPPPPEIVPPLEPFWEPYQKKITQAYLAAAEKKIHAATTSNRTGAKTP